MEEDRVSRTALMTAFYRGYHAAHDTPTIFNDCLASLLLPEEDRICIEEMLLRGFQEVNPVGAAQFADHAGMLAWLMQSSAAPPILLSRARYAEETLEQAVDQGVAQYVLLGAGLDSFVFRRPKLVEKLRVYEVDHPATQSYKRRRLAELGWEPPKTLQYVPLDFTRQSLTAALRQAGYAAGVRTFFSWLGVTYYLTRDQVFSTFREIASGAVAGSSLVFDYLDTDAFIPKKASPRVLRMLSGVHALGEPMLAGFDPLQLADELAPHGLRLQEGLSPGDIHRRYFLGRSDHYRACEHMHLAHVMVE